MKKRDRKIISLYKKRVLVKEIAKIVDCDISTIYNILKRNKIPLRYDNRISRNQVKQIVSLYKKGKRIFQICKIIGCNLSTIYNILKRNKISLRYDNRISHNQVKQIINLYKKGVLVKEIAKIVGCDLSTISHIVKKNNFPIRCKRLKVTKTGRICTKCLKWKLWKEFDSCNNKYGHISRCKTCMYIQRLTDKYDLSLGEYNLLRKKQNDCCIICGKEVKLSVDHCHKSGKVRGLLCEYCNWGLGLFYDNPKYLQQAIKYLKKHA